MGDHERRNGHRGGGGYNRKRRHRDDDDGDRRQQRRRYEEPLAVKVRRQLLTIAESAARKAEDDVANLAKTVAENYEDAELRAGFVELAVQLTLEQPFKIPFVAATILIANTHNSEIAGRLLQSAGEDLQENIALGKWRNVKLLLRLLACLQGIYDGDGVFTILEELFSRAVDLQTTSSDDSLGLELVKIILLTIPYAMSSSATGFEAHASSLLEKTDIIASTPHALEALVDPLPTEEGGPQPKTESAIGLLQRQLTEESKNGWPLACLPRPWKIDREVKPEGEEAGQDPLQSATKHAFPTVAVPDSVKNGPKAIYPDMYLSVYDGQEMETVPPTSNVASSLLRDAIVDTINILDFNRIATARFLIDIDCYFTPHTFVKRATPFDKLRELGGDKPTWKPEDVAVDAVFSQLIQLPSPEHKLVYYHSVLTEACKIAPAAIAPSLGRAIRFFYCNMAQIDLDLGHRFLDWFAHHLSNFGFTWKWTEWVDDVGLPDVHPKKAFIVGALDKEIRLSFAQRIKGTLPDPYQPLITEAKEKDTPDFKYSQETTPYAKEGYEIMQLIRRKAPDEEIQPLIESIQQQAISHGVDDPLAPSTDAYVTSICYVGSKSLSHVLSCIERSKERLLAIGPQSPPARRQIITSVMEYWADQPGIGINIIDKLLNYTILTPLSVVEWVLLDRLAAGTILSEAHIYEMVAATVGKVTNRIRQIVAARVQPGLVEPQLGLLDETLTRERGDMQALFKLIEDTLVAVADGSNDQMFERSTEDSTSVETDIIRQWGQRWLRVFRRKSAVEEAFINEAMLSAVPLGTTAPPVAPAPEAPAEVPEPAAAVGVDGTAGADADLMADIE